MAEARWYVTRAAVEDFQRIALIEDDEGRAERELLDLVSGEAVRDTGTRTDSGAEVWRTGRIRVGRRERAVRLELTVSTATRPEGPLPQLIRVREKGGRRGEGRERGLA